MFFFNSSDWDLIVGPEISEAGRASFDVEEETEALFQSHARCILYYASLEEAPTILPFCVNLFQARLKRWWTLTGGWNNVDERIRRKYGDDFINMVGETCSIMARAKTLAQANKSTDPKKEEDAATSTSSSEPSLHPHGTQSPFDVVGATRALYQVGKLIERSPETVPVTVRALFEHLAIIWWGKTGGPARVPKAILAPYPHWFVRKLETFKHKTPVSDTAANKPPAFDVKDETRLLFEIATKRFPRAPQGLDDDCPDLALEQIFHFALLRWCENAIGWHKVDKGIRTQYPEWFVDQVAKAAQVAPLAKIFALDDLNKRKEQMRDEQTAVHFERLLMR